MEINQDYIHEVQAIIGSWIREMRKERGLTLEDCGKLVGCNAGTMSKIENGVWLSIPMLIRLSVALDFSFLLYRNEDC